MNEKKKIDIVICAWTKSVKHAGIWIPLEEYLTKVLGISFSHSISPEGKKKMLEVHEEELTLKRPA